MIECVGADGVRKTTTAKTVITNGWHSLMVTYNQSTLTIYVDGVVDTAAAAVDGVVVVAAAEH